VSQPFDVHMRNEVTGESWSVVVDAVDPPGAVQKVARRRRFAEALCSEQPHTFVVSDRDETWDAIARAASDDQEARS
jgi:hypothetical protein